MRDQGPFPTALPRPKLSPLHCLFLTFQLSYLAAWKHYPWNLFSRNANHHKQDKTWLHKLRVSCRYPGGIIATLRCCVQLILLGYISQVTFNAVTWATQDTRSWHIATSVLSCCQREESGTGSFPRDFPGYSVCDFPWRSPAEAVFMIWTMWGSNNVLGGLRGRCNMHNELSHQKLIQPNRLMSGNDRPRPCPCRKSDYPYKIHIVSVGRFQNKRNQGSLGHSHPSMGLKFTHSVGLPVKILPRKIFLSWPQILVVTQFTIAWIILVNWPKWGKYFPHLLRQIGHYLFKRGT